MPTSRSTSTMSSGSSRGAPRDRRHLRGRAAADRLFRPAMRRSRDARRRAIPQSAADRFRHRQRRRQPDPRPCRQRFRSGPLLSLRPRPRGASNEIMLVRPQLEDVPLGDGPARHLSRRRRHPGPGLSHAAARPRRRAACRRSSCRMAARARATNGASTGSPNISPIAAMRCFSPIIAARPAMATHGCSRTASRAGGPRSATSPPARAGWSRRASPIRAGWRSSAGPMAAMRRFSRG